MRAETKLQRQIREHLTAKGYRAVACSNGAVLAGDARSRAIQMNTLKAAGLTPGFPDLVVYGPHGRIGHLEVKLPGESLSEKQVEVHAWLLDWQQDVAVAYSIEDADSILAEWGW